MPDTREILVIIMVISGGIVLTLGGYIFGCVKTEMKEEEKRYLIEDCDWP